ncbi:MAG TPA: ScyD/ScyE family protein, partial [Acidimicrobiia bacterium]
CTVGRALMVGAFRRLLTGLLSISLGVVVGLATAALLGAFPSPVVVEGLTAPRGLTPTNDGGLLIAEVGAGRLLEMSPEGDVSVIADNLPFTLISGPQNKYPAGPSAVIRRDGEYFYVVGGYIEQGFSELYRLEPGGTPEPMTGQEISNRFGSNAVTNPYDLVPASGGGFLVSDSGINAILYISEDGEVFEYLDFPSRDNPQPSEGPAEFEVVPTGIARGPDHAVYVASLTGFPYPEGAAQVYRIEDVTATGETSVDGEFTVFADGFTAATDLVFDADGSMLVTEYSTDMRALAEDDIREAQRVPGRLVRWRDGEITVVADGLVSPSSVTITDGRIFVSEEFAGRVTEIPTGSSGANAAAWVWAVLAGAAAAVLALLAARMFSPGRIG